MRLLRRLFGGTARTDHRPRPEDNSEAGRWRKALSDFGYPHRLIGASDAEAALRAERELGLQQGFVPILIAPGHWNSTPISADERTRRALAAISDRHDAAFGRSFLKTALEDMRRDLSVDPEGPDPHLFGALRPVSAAPRAPGLLLLQRYNPHERVMQPIEAVAIMRIPTTHSAWIPVYLDWGGWNAVPAPLEIAAVAQYWAETHGATLTAMTSDQLEFSVARPPASHADAVALLKEHYVFAPDTYEFDQGVLEQAAAELQVADSWAFWWD